VDQIFDRFERLFKSWVAQESDHLGKTLGGAARRSGDPDLDAAMDELDDFLGSSRDEDREAREAERRREEARRRAQEEASRPPPDTRLADAYAYLGLPMGCPFDEVKAKYRKLLLKHHPDRHVGSPENQRLATQTSAKINEAYRLIETWTTTGKLP
jgi:DnaJ-domain-containing protein 1